MTNRGNQDTKSTYALRLACWMLLAGVVAPGLCAAEAPAWVVQGQVLDATTAQPVVGARIHAAKGEATTDQTGHFTLALSQPLQTLEVSREGYLTERIAGGALTHEDGPVIRLERQARFHDEIEVHGSPLSDPPAQVPLRPADVVGVAGGAENVFRVLTTLPGVVGTNEFSSRISVRGGGPDQNLTAMDGVEIHDPYRLYGLVSAFNPETVDNFELITGAFSAKYGDRLSSILIVNNRAGSSRKTISGSSALSLTDTNTILEGPLPDNSGSWILTGRRTYYDLVAERFTSSDLPSFGDLQGKIVWDRRQGRRLIISGLYSREGTNASLTGDDHKGTLYTRTRNDLLSGTFEQSLGGGGLLRTVASYYETSDDKDVDGRFRGGMRRSNAPDDQDVDYAKVIWRSATRIRDLSLRQEVSLKASEKHAVEAGFELHRLETSVTFDIAGQRNLIEANGSSIMGGAGLPNSLDSSRSDTRVGAWLIDRMRLGRALEIETGLRLDRNSINDDTELQPRLQASLGFNATTRLRLGVGRHTQSPGYEKLVSADYFLDLSDRGALLVGNEHSTHALASLERDLAPGWLARVEGYYKGFDHLLVGRMETPEETQARLAQYDVPPSLAGSIPTYPIITSTPSNGGSGRAYGVDVMLVRKATSESTRITGWASYTWGRAESTSYGRTYPFDYDCRHNVSLVGQLRLSRRFDLAVTGRFTSGFPSTPPVGLKISSVPDEQDVDGDGNRTELIPERDKAGRLVYALDLGSIANMNTARQPAYARVDARLTYKPRSGRLSVYLDVINVFNRKNVGMMEHQLEYDPNSDRPRIVEQGKGSIPFLPSLGVHYRF